MRIIFMGSAEFAVPSLRALQESTHEVVATFSQPLRPKGRGMKLLPTPLHACADDYNLPVRTPLKLDAGEVDFLQKAEADLLVVVAYGLLIPQAVLDIFPCGGVNVHPSLLPRWRGAAPIERAIAAGDEKTGVTIMQMTAELDAGDILAQQEMRVGDKRASELHEVLSHRGAELLLQVIDRGGFVGVPQGAGVTYAKKWQKAEALLDFNESAEVLARKIRAADSLGGCYFMAGGERIKVWGAAAGAPSADAIGSVSSDWQITCGDGVKLRLLILQKQGNKRQVVQEFMQINPVSVGLNLIKGL